MKIDERMYARLPDHLKALFTKLPNPGSDEVLAGFPETESVASVRSGVPEYRKGKGGERTNDGRDAENWERYRQQSERRMAGFSDSGSAARFFYCAKSSTEERGEGNNHPTVKPIALMRWLVRLVTPKGGTVLDPFMGSGSTALACDAEQFDFIGCELSSEYAAIAQRRIRDAAGMFADITIDPPTPVEAAA